MRVLTMNVFGRRADWPARRRLPRETVARLDPNLVAFQEVPDRQGPPPPDQIGLTEPACGKRRAVALGGAEGKR